MELRDLLIIDVDSLSAAHAKQIVNDTIDVLTKGGVTGDDQWQLKKLLIAAQEIATGRKVGDNPDNSRQEVLKKIQEAELRGDKRTARYLAEAVGKRDLEAANIADAIAKNKTLAILNAKDANDAALRHKNYLERIEHRTHEILRTRGSDFNFSIKLAREMATKEMWRPRYEDDVNQYEPVKPNRQDVLDTAAGKKVQK